MVHSDCNHDINLSPHTKRCLWARHTPHIAIQAIQAQTTKETAKMRRMSTFQRRDTGLEDVKMIVRQRS